MFIRARLAFSGRPASHLESAPAPEEARNSRTGPIKQASQTHTHTITSARVTESWRARTSRIAQLVAAAPAGQRDRQRQPSPASPIGAGLAGWSCSNCGAWAACSSVWLPPARACYMAPHWHEQQFAAAVALQIGRVVWTCGAFGSYGARAPEQLRGRWPPRTRTRLRHRPTADEDQLGQPTGRIARFD